jgi:hypothetical protein
MISLLYLLLYVVVAVVVVEIVLYILNALLGVAITPRIRQLLYAVIGILALIWLIQLLAGGGILYGPAPRLR